MRVWTAEDFEKALKDINFDILGQFKFVSHFRVSPAQYDALQESNFFEKGSRYRGKMVMGTVSELVGEKNVLKDHEIVIVDTNNFFYHWSDLDAMCSNLGDKFQNYLGEGI